MAWDSLEALVDVHAHFLTDRYVAAARAAGHENPDGMPGWPAWSADEHLRLMDQWNVETAFLSISSPGVHFGGDTAARVLAQHVNDAGAGLRRDHSDRYGHFASLPLPNVEGALAELSRALDDLGSDGVAVETNTEGVYLGDERYEPLYAELARRQAVVFVHPTSPPCAEQLALGRPRPMMEFLFDTTRAVTDLLFSGVFARHRQIRWVFTHGGGALPLLADRLRVVPRRPRGTRRRHRPGTGVSVVVRHGRNTVPRIRCRRWHARSAPVGCSTAVTSGPRAPASRHRFCPSIQQPSPRTTRGGHSRHATPAGLFAARRI